MAAIRTKLLDEWINLNQSINRTSVSLLWRRGNGKGKGRGDAVGNEHESNAAAIYCEEATVKVATVHGVKKSGG